MAALAEAVALAVALVVAVVVLVAVAVAALGLGLVVVGDAHPAATRGATTSNSVTSNRCFFTFSTPVGV